jgi:hypothetical protein
LKVHKRKKTSYDEKSGGDTEKYEKNGYSPGPGNIAGVDFPVVRGIVPAVFMGHPKDQRNRSEAYKKGEARDGCVDHEFRLV